MEVKCWRSVQHKTLMIKEHTLWASSLYLNWYAQKFSRYARNVLFLLMCFQVRWVTLWVLIWDALYTLLRNKDRCLLLRPCFFSNWAVSINGPYGTWPCSGQGPGNCQMSVSGMPFKPWVALRALMSNTLLWFLYSDPWRVKYVGNSQLTSRFPVSSFNVVSNANYMIRKGRPTCTLMP